MSKRKKTSSEEDSPLLRNLEPTTLENLKAAQVGYEAIGLKMSLEEVAQFEMGELIADQGLDEE